ncbi:nucleotidyl transferase AbiEii/AbiGii toxin family protein [uncultured Marinobacter sp.]|uniref:nucleotidyl transferase AbiEii/AbiGii toxin family protein n=1 Tax=uncultured Marinobacter sp. TaxID=187379 RepID=UPI002593B63B|nr:nucleotidyl transferase AbiEii/AbiGii toxin family protein [uncultured Marinobacter sp.]
MSVIDQMLARYPVGEGQMDLALREVMQEIALAGLYRGGFFDNAAFYGGTCLRIFYGLPRFSEDLDFSLLQADPDFSLEPFFRAIQDEFSAFGFEVTLTAKEKRVRSTIESAFLKKTSSLYDLVVKGRKTLKIKLEVDKDPPGGFATEERLLLQPFSFYTKCFVFQDLFAGKMHALLFRKWNNRVKGRDWYDFEWYVRQGAGLGLAHFVKRGLQSGDIASPCLDERDFRNLLHQRIDSLDVRSAKMDVERFIPEPRDLDVWSRDYFHALADRLKFA